MDPSESTRAPRQRSDARKVSGETTAAQSTILAFALRILSGVATSAMVLAVGMLLMYAYSKTNCLQRSAHVNARPQEDICYHVADVDRWYYNETVIDTRAKGSAWAEERLAAGQQNCYCNRYLLRGLKPSERYTFRASHLGSKMSSISIAMAQVRRSRLEKTLSEPANRHLQSEVPPEYGLTFPSSSSSKPRGAHHVRPTDCQVVELQTDARGMLDSAHGVVVYDAADVPQWVEDERIDFFNWSTTSQAVSWEMVHFAKALGIHDHITFNYEGRDMKGIGKPPEPDPWHMDAAENQAVSDPFLPLAEVCGGYLSRSEDPKHSQSVHRYHFIVAVAPYGLPDYSLAVVQLLSAVAGIGQILFFTRW